jgi:FlaG/FlaF family flagellin (archaellin)
MTGTDERAVSSVISFVFAFSFIILSVGLVYSVGFGALTEFQNDQQVAGATVTMESLGNSFEEIQRGGGPVRTSEIRLADGSIALTGGAVMNVTVSDGGGNTLAVTNSTDDPEKKTPTFVTRALSYRYDDTSVSYEGGAVFNRQDNGGTSVLRAPPIRCSSDVAIISVVSLELSGGVKSVDSRNTVSVEAIRRSQRLVYPAPNNTASDAASVTIDLTSSPNMEGWESYLDERAADNSNLISTASGYRCDTNRVIVRHTVVRVFFI